MKDLRATIFDIKHFAIHDGSGIRTTVFFKGCPLHCNWCHNPEGIDSKIEIQFAKAKCINCRSCEKVCLQNAHVFGKGEHLFFHERCIACGMCTKVCLTNALMQCGRRMSVKEVLTETMEDVEFYEKSGGGVTLSGGECLCQSAFCAELLKELKKHNISTAVDTSGYIPQKALEEVLPFTDIFLYDIKHIDSEMHERYTGVNNKVILDNLDYLGSFKKKIEIRIPLIPRVNDDEETIHAIGKLLQNYHSIESVRVIPYNNLINSKYEMIGKKNTAPKIDPPSEQVLSKVKKILESYGLKSI